MRRLASETFVVAMLAIAGGCYDPALTEGLACSPNQACPSGQECDPATNQCLRDPAPPIDAGERDAPIDTPIDAAIDAPPDGPSEFHDDFSRANSSALGNGWIEKTPVSFALQNGEAVPSSGANYRDSLCYRPASEDVLDVEISVQVRFTASPPGPAQIFVRGVSASINTPDSYDGYLLFVGGTDVVNLGRQIGTPFVTLLSTFPLSQALNTTDTYRLTLGATGTTSVLLTARMDRLVSGAWNKIGETSVMDTAASRIVGAGTVGFSTNGAVTFLYDDFRRIER